MRDIFQKYGILILSLVLIVVLSVASDAFLTPRNILNILNQAAPLALIASALTLAIIAGNFDLSAGSIFGVASVLAATVAVNVDPVLGLVAGPAVGLALGIANGLIVTGFSVHPFLATIATAVVYRGLAILIAGGGLIPVRSDIFNWLGRGRIGMVHIAIIILALFSASMMFLLNGTTFGRRVRAVGGNEEAAILSGVRTDLIKIATFALTGLAAGLAGTIAVSRIGVGQPTAGAGMELDAIAAVIIGGTSIYGGAGAVWRSLAGVLLLALIGNGFNILNVDPFLKDLTTGLVILVAVGLSARRRAR
jgi:ribose transport system permease protein